MALLMTAYHFHQGPTPTPTPTPAAAAVPARGPDDPGPSPAPDPAPTGPDEPIPGPGPQSGSSDADAMTMDLQQLRTFLEKMKTSEEPSMVRLTSRLDKIPGLAELSDGRFRWVSADVSVGCRVWGAGFRWVSVECWL